jgi:hypothetical protein
MAESDLAALSPDVEAEDLEVATAQGGVDHACTQQQAVVTAETHARLLKDQILDDVGLEATQAEAGLAFLDQRMEFGPMLRGHEDGVTAYARRPHVEPIGGGDRGTDARANRGPNRLPEVGESAERKDHGESDQRSERNAKQLGPALGRNSQTTPQIG